MINTKVSIYAIMKIGIANGAVLTKNMTALLSMVEKKVFGTVGKRMAKQSGVSSRIKKVVHAQNRTNILSVNAMVAVKADVQLGMTIVHDAGLNLTNSSLYGIIG